MRRILALAFLLIGGFGLYVGLSANRLVREHFAPIAARNPDPTRRALAFNREVHRLFRSYNELLALQGQVDNSSDPRYRLVDNILYGGGLCAHRALLLITALKQFGIPARKVSLVEPGGQYLCHVAVEVFLDGHWRVFDPTFGYTYPLPDGRLTTVDDLRRDDRLVRDVALRDPAPYPFPYPLDVYRYDRTMRFNWFKIRPTRALAAWIGPTADLWQPPYLFDRPALLAGYLGLATGSVLLLIELLILRRERRLPADASGGDTIFTRPLLGRTPPPEPSVSHRMRYADGGDST